MFHIHKSHPWTRLRPTDESIYWNRRKVLKSLGLTTGALLSAPALLQGCARGESKESGDVVQEVDNNFTFDGIENYFPADRNTKYTLDRSITEEYWATHYNNFYEFIDRSDPNIYNAYKFVDKFDTRDWSFEVKGLANNTGKFTLEDIIKKFGQEERTYRFRCVERWAMAVPWTGFPLKKLIDFCEPQSGANFVRMVSFADAQQMPGVAQQTWYPWPYFEGLRMDEAMNELAFMATGLYGKPLPKQNGAPMRLVVPWKYGYKNTKSIVLLEFVRDEPGTFWNTLAPDEYGFLSNIDPEVPHPRWSQAMEKMIPDGDWQPTQKYNGYQEYVGNLYS